MKSYNKIAMATLALIIIIFASANIYMLSSDKSTSDRLYRVEANRIINDIEKKGIDGIDFSEYDMVTAVYVMDDKNKTTFFDTQNEYLIRQAGGRLYRIEYTAKPALMNKNTIVMVNIFLALMAAVIIGAFLFVRQKILKPFHRLYDIPYELAKGNLNLPIKENKSRFFGKFIWGMDLLRENMEQQRQRELSLQKEKKTLVLSISHDIKTPLSAIKLYAKALEKGLYTDKEKIYEVAGNIDKRTDEIENFVTEIIKASNEDFLNLSVNQSEFYLSELISKISAYYGEKLELVKIPFSIGRYSDCLIKGDIDRGIEVLQNIIENAIKYGDGHSINLSFSEEEDCQLIAVKNSGCSLSDAELPHIFDSFWRGSNTGNESGSGLGLYICRKLMQKMDGDIFAEIRDGDMDVTTVFRNA